MSFSLIARVDRKTWTSSGLCDYGLEVISLNVIDDNRDFIEQLENARIYSDVLSWSSGRDVILNHRQDIDDLISEEGISEQNGGAVFQMPSGPLGGLYASFIAGSENYALISECLDEALKSEHLYVQLFAPVTFSMFEENEYLKRPVTRQQFLSGTVKYEGNLVPPQLVRRHIS
ncbi:hypothetical protein [Sphingorhabdus sp.]|uniref:hypothetical protein n=1 Tax=Sphingorhabdus sp. TaxID=1902408 RepID=UPI003D816DA7